MKRFFDDGAARAASPATASQLPDTAVPGTVTLTGGPAGARIAVYDGLAAAPRVEDVTADGLADAIEQLASRTYNLARERGGTVPYTIIREIAENLVHAGFREVVVTILDDGRTIRFADQGPGIADKERAFLPGYSTASAEMKRLIRGVGSGLPIVRETLSFTGGTIEIEDNLGNGTVVTVCAAPQAAPGSEPDAPEPPRLSDRQKQIVSLVMELGSVGPSVVARELDVSVATAHRDLTFLEEAGIIAPDETGKRALTPYGMECLEKVLR